MEQDGNGVMPRPNSRSLYPSEFYPVYPGTTSEDERRLIPLHNGVGSAVLHPVSTFYMDTDCLDSFFYTVNFLLTRPEVVYKRVYTSYITKFKYESDVDLDAKYVQDIFHRLIRKEDLALFLDGTLKKVELERVLVIDNPQQNLVTFFEKWDFAKKQILYGPKVRTEYAYQEDTFKDLIPLMECELTYDAFEEAARFDSFGIYPDDHDLLGRLLAIQLNVEKMFDTCTPAQWEIKNSGFKNHPSLLHVDRTNYLDLYVELKEEHFQQLKQVWVTHEESTDYRKYIPEDLHIATYLGCLQDNPNSPIQFGKKFVDLGCGNGLLTHLLTQCGWKGYGIDCRKRKLWNYFGDAGADLEEWTILYNSSLRDVDNETILIGNHPDELCPLIPLLARQSGAAGFIIIPCCAFDVFGNKYNRANALLSVYESHLRALITMCKSLGFEVLVDKLRIPSTKRVAIIGQLRKEGPDMKASQEAFDEIMLDLDVYQPNIRLPREKFLRVNNCTQLCRGTCEAIIEDIFDCIYFSDCKNCESCDKIDEWGAPPKWHVGCEKVTIGMLASVLPESRLKFLKDQGKGLQTLIKNYSDIFTLVDEFVRIHLPDREHVQKMVAKGQEKKLRTKPCFFLSHHLDGCPLKEKECAFSHEKSLSKVPATLGREPLPKFAFVAGEAKRIAESDLDNGGGHDPDRGYPSESDEDVGFGPYEGGEEVPDFEDEYANGPVFYV